MVVTPSSFESYPSEPGNPTQDILEAMKLVSMRKTKNYLMLEFSERPHQKAGGSDVLETHEFSDP